MFVNGDDLQNFVKFVQDEELREKFKFWLSENMIGLGKDETKLIMTCFKIALRCFCSSILPSNAIKNQKNLKKDKNIEF